MSVRPGRADPYADFAERYDLFYGGFGEHAPEQVGFLKDLFARHRVRRVLDCACGTGNDLELLHGLGYEVLGSDLSAAMLRQARGNLSARGLELPLFRADFRELPWRDGTFDALLCLTTSLPHLLEEPDVIRALHDMWRVLASGGILVLSQGLTDKLLTQRPRFIPEINTVDFSRLFALDYLDRKVRINVLDLVHEPERQELKVNSFEYLVLLRDDYRRLLTETGYQTAEFYSGYSAQPYDPETSDRLVVVARKPARQSSAIQARHS